MSKPFSKTLDSPPNLETKPWVRSHCHLNVQQTRAIAGWVVVMVPLVWLNWWLVPGNELLADDTAMPVSPEQLHYPSLVAIVAVSVIYVAAVRWLTHRSAASQVDAPSYSNAS